MPGRHERQVFAASGLTTAASSLFRTSARRHGVTPIYGEARAQYDRELLSLVSF